MMKWHLIESGFLTGRQNMDLDVQLTKDCKDDEAFFRLYRWDPYCISLGANQKESDIDLERLYTDGLQLVKRPTGGRAILHSQELTYAVIIPLSIGLSPKEIYAKVSNALVRGLMKYHPSLAANLELENIQPNFPELLKEPSGVLCFASTAKSEVKFDSKKLIGSAQRKMGNIVLQHGSILCGTFHQKLAEYLSADEVLKSLMKEELASKTTELETILNIPTDYQLLSQSLIAGFEEEWQIEFSKSLSSSLHF